MLRALRVIVWLCGPAPRLRCGPAPSPPGRFACAGGGVVEYPGKVACPSGRRCSTRNAVWCHSHPGFKSQRYRHCRPAPLGPGGFVMPTWRVWGACCPDRSPAVVRPARPLAVRAASFARRVVSKPGQAPQASRRPPIGRGCLCVAWPGPAAHGHRSQAFRLPPALSMPVVPSWLMLLAHRLVVRPGPAAHGHRGQALRLLRGPPCWLRWGFALHERVVGVSWF